MQLSQRYISKLFTIFDWETNYIFRKKSTSVFPKWRYIIMLISSGNSFGSTINPWKPLECFFDLYLSHTASPLFLSLFITLAHFLFLSLSLVLTLYIHKHTVNAFKLAHCFWQHHIWGHKNSRNCDCLPGYTGKLCTTCKLLIDINQ